ncbi:urea carboxylase [Rariglobus hedericola]|uniref:Urea carboxylase n=1 Tax=Rariglobus hedericola TaxID=2597822 RepID=A0A556QKD0_9BACT|nr:urea carboxylase [Rariglobus hedericola]TSJ77088.1 urea carboxylase [Rariglobus hedericola]
MFSKVLIANRGAIACRVIRTLKKMGIASVAVYSDADRHSLHVSQADEAIHIGPSPAAQSYLDADKILAAAKATGAQAIHPGYGFLSENAAFVEACEAAGIAFIGPRAAQMRQLGPKHSARALAKAHGVPLLPGTDLLPDLETAKREAARIGYPVMLKSTGGGGGIGMSLIRKPAELAPAFESVVRLAKNNFKDGGVFLEKFVEHARHIEVQILGDSHGHVVALGERDCSVQRRNQKVVEETPAPGLTADQRTELLACAARLGTAAGYTNAGTVEFVYDNATGHFYFLEVNTRLQVEHGVTEEVTGIDLVEWMILSAAGELDLRNYVPSATGASIQVRLYAEDAGKNFQPAAGTLTDVHFQSSARIETWVETGSEVSAFYDPMIAKIIVRGTDRADALARLDSALADTRVYGLETNLPYLRQIIASEGFHTGSVTTKYLNGLPFVPSTIEVLEGGTQTTVQDYPGRIGYWDVGVPPSGPMDNLSFRLANRLVGNPDTAAALELTVNGPSLRFNTAAVVALTGAHMPATLDNKPVAPHRAFRIRAGQTLRIGSVSGAGLRAYLAIRHGLDVPDYLGSKSTFTLGLFGGHSGRALRTGDVLRVHTSTPGGVTTDAPLLRAPAAIQPPLTREWSIGVLYGPHGAPDFFTEADISVLLTTAYEVHYNSARTGVRLIGPKPEWARRDGGEAGLHPSNIHDNAYAIGAVDFTGDMPIILGPDGPSCGGFVCPFTIVQAELWKMGQLKPGDKVRFVALTAQHARELAYAQESTIETLRPSRTSKPLSREGYEGSEGSNQSSKTPNPSSEPSLPSHPSRDTPPEPAVLHELPARPTAPAAVYRRQGDANLLIEYGPLQLDIAMRMRVHALQTWLERHKVPGLIDLTPGIRSLQVHFDYRLLPMERLLEILLRAESELPAIDDIEVPSRIVHLPLSWEDESTLLAIRKYMQIVRKDAPWCPSNLEFIRRINDLPNLEEVYRICFDASYLVLALGDVYLGAPVATPVDPRHRLVTTKYNPARTWTPENAVGIGGAYLCIYGMEGPGGYQFIGRTCQMWNRHKQTADFTDGKPWLLRFFDQIKFYPVSNAELTQFREDFPQGRVKLRIEETTFKLRDYQRFLSENEATITAFKTHQQPAFEAERQRWIDSGQINFSASDESASSLDESAIPEGCVALPAHIPGNVWKILVSPNDTVTEGQPLVILESMKMEVTVSATRAGVIREIRCAEGRPVNAGETLIVLEG